MNIEQDLLVQCLKCFNTYHESEEVFIGVCPHCQNNDRMQTVYLPEVENEEV